MANQNIDIQISKESKAMLKEVTKFTSETMCPAGIELDRLENPLDITKNGSLFWDVFKAYRALDLHLLSIPGELGGLGDLDWLTSLLIKEQMGYADVGLSLSLMASDIPFIYASMCDVSELKQTAMDYFKDLECEMIGCWKITENNGDRQNTGVKAIKKNDTYMLNGEITRVPNGIIATHALINLEIGDIGQNKKQGVAIIPLDLPGISREKPVNKIGQRSLSQGNIVFQDVKLPMIYVIDDDMAAVNKISKSLNAANNLDVGIIHSGLALSAFDEARKYSGERIQGGVPIFEHKNIKQKLFIIFTMVESARAYTRRMASYNAENPSVPSETHSVAIKCLSTQTAADVSSEGIQIFGGNGLAKEYPMEKLFRDAQTGIVENGVNEMLSLKAADLL